MGIIKKRLGIDMSVVMPNMRMEDPKVQNLFRAAEKVGFSVTPDGSDQLDGDCGLYDDPGLPQLELSLCRYPNLHCDLSDGTAYNAIRDTCEQISESHPQNGWLYFKQ